MIKIFRKKYRSMSLKWKISYRLLIALLLLFILVDATQYFSMRSYLMNSQLRTLKLKLHSMEGRSSKYDNDEKLEANYSELIYNVADNQVGAAIINSQGKIIVEQKNNSKEFSHNVPEFSKDFYKKLFTSIDTHDYYVIAKDNQGYSHMVVWQPIITDTSSVVMLQLNTPLESVNRILYQQLIMSILIGFAAVIVFMLISSSIFKHSLAPLHNMAETVSKIDVGELSLRLPEKTKIKETDKLSTSFNSMLERLETSFENERIVKEKMKKFIADASHELRTPLTSIHGFVEVLLRGAAKNEEQLERALNSMLTESERLGDLVNNLLLLTRLDGDVKYEMKPESLKEVLDEIKLQLEVMVKNRELQIHIAEDYYILANRGQLKQIIFNLVHNAVQHTDGYSGTIAISAASVDNSYVELSIKDNGEGISEENLQNIFDRFYRIETDRARRSGGYGLGLSIVKSIVDAHEGTIAVESSLGKGTEFKIRFKSI